MQKTKKITKEENDNEGNQYCMEIIRNRNRKRKTYPAKRGKYSGRNLLFTGADTSAPLSEAVDTNEYGEYSMNDRVNDYLKAKYHFNPESFDIENGECAEILDTLNRVLDNEVDVYGAVHVIQSLLDTGVEPSTIINDLKFDEDDVLVVLNEQEMEEENGLE